MKPKEKLTTPSTEISPFVPGVYETSMSHINHNITSYLIRLYDTGYSDSGA